MMTNNEKLDLILQTVLNISERLEVVEQRLEVIEQRLEVVEQRLEVVEQRLEVVEQRLEVVEQRLDAVEQRLEVVEQRLDILEGRIETVDQTLGAKIIDIRLHFENFTDKNIQTLAQNHLALNDRLHRIEEAISKYLIYEVQVRHLSDRMLQVEQEITVIKNRIA